MNNVENILRSVVDEYRLSPDTKAAVEHSLFPPGKRVRARLVLAATCDLRSVEPDLYARKAAAAVELLHCASLVHDDLPALDNDLLRRGRPTVHAKFGAGVATLVGDVVATMAFGFQELHQPSVATAFIELCDGQVLDLAKARSAEQLIEIHRKKTGALFRLCMELAVRPIGDVNLLEESGAFGELLGVEFQLANDLNDYEDSRGAATSSDTRNDRLGEQVAGELSRLFDKFHAARKAAQGALELKSSTELRGIREIVTELFGE